MKAIQQKIFDQYIEWLFDNKDNIREALIGLKEIASPEAIDPLIRFIEYACERYNEGRTYGHYECWDTNKKMAREALDAIYIKSGQESLQDDVKLTVVGFETPREWSEEELCDLFGGNASDLSIKDETGQ